MRTTKTRTSDSAVIPYGGQPPGSKRVLDLFLKRSLVVKGLHPTVGIDGLSYLSSWGMNRFEIPGDRAVHVSVHLQRRSQVGTASCVLPPDQPAALDYSAPSHLGFPGSIGPRGTTRAKGAFLRAALLTTTLVAAVALVAFVTWIWTSAFS